MTPALIYTYACGCQVREPLGRAYCPTHGRPVLKAGVCFEEDDPRAVQARVLETGYRPQEPVPFHPPTPPRGGSAMLPAPPDEEQFRGCPD